MGDCSPTFQLPTYFPDIDTLRPCQTVSPHQDHVLAVWQFRFGDQNPLLALMSKLQRLNSHLFYEAQVTKHKIFQNGAWCTAYLFPLVHQLLSMSGNAIIANDKDLNVLHAVRIGCLLYTAGVRRLFGVMCISNKAQTATLRYCLEQSKNDWAGLDVLRMWCLAMGGMEAHGENRSWFMNEVVKEGQTLGFDNWQDLEMYLEDMIWCIDAHRPRFWSLYHGLDETYSSGRDWTPRPGLISPQPSIQTRPADDPRPVPSLVT